MPLNSPMPLQSDIYCPIRCLFPAPLMTNSGAMTPGRGPFTADNWGVLDASYIAANEFKAFWILDTERMTT